MSYLNSALSFSQNFTIHFASQMSSLDFQLPDERVQNIFSRTDLEGPVAVQSILPERWLNAMKSEKAGLLTHFEKIQVLSYLGYDADSFMDDASLLQKIEGYFISLQNMPIELEKMNNLSDTLLENFISSLCCEFRMDGANISITDQQIVFKFFQFIQDLRTIFIEHLKDYLIKSKGENDGYKSFIEDIENPEHEFYALGQEIIYTMFDKFLEVDDLRQKFDSVKKLRKKSEKENILIKFFNRYFEKSVDGKLVSKIETWEMKYTFDIFEECVCHIDELISKFENSCKKIGNFDKFMQHLVRKNTHITFQLDQGIVLKSMNIRSDGVCFALCKRHLVNIFNDPKLDLHFSDVDQIFEKDIAEQKNAIKYRLLEILHLSFLRPSDINARQIFNKNMDQFKDPQIVDLLSKEEGAFLLWINHGILDQGHTMLLRLDSVNKKYYFFDPNFGVFEFRNKIETINLCLRVSRCYHSSSTTSNKFILYRCAKGAL